MKKLIEAGGSAPEVPAGRITIECGEEKFELESKDLHNDSTHLEIKEAAQESSDVVVTITNLAKLVEDDQWAFFSLIDQLDDPSIGFVRDHHDSPTPDLLEAFLHGSPGNEELHSLLRKKSTALRIAAWFYSDDLREACGVIKNSLKIPGSKLDDFYDQALQLRDHVDSHFTQESDDLVTVLDALPDAPVSPDAVVPIGWVLNEDGVHNLGFEVTIPVPIVISRRGKCIDTGEETWRISWKREGRWDCKVVDRADCADARSIVKLAKHGVSVTSNNGKVLVQYLSDYETANLESIEVEKVVSRTGFHDGVGFLAGLQLVTAEKIIDTAKGKDEIPVVFRGADDGDEQLVEGFHSSGTYKKWLRAVSMIAPFPKVKLALYASFVPPMLKILKSSNFVFDLAGETSRGKTTAARLRQTFLHSPLAAK